MRLGLETWPQETPTLTLRRRTRTFIGALAMLTFVAIYAPLAMALADSRIALAPKAVQALAYCALGILWIVPMMPLVRWMSRPDPDGT